MLRDHLEIDESDTLERVEEILLKTVAVKRSPDGRLKGRTAI